MAGNHGDCTSPRESPPPGAPLCSGSPQTHLQTGCSGQHPEMELDNFSACGTRSPPDQRPSSHIYEELFCGSQTAIPLLSALATPSGPQSDVVKQGYLGKQDKSHRHYFVLRAGSHTGPSRLEWYKNQEKFSASEKSTGKTMWLRHNKHNVIYLRSCLGLSRIGNSRRGHTLALYGKEQSVVMVMENQQQSEDWYTAMQRLIEEEQMDEERGDGMEEEEDDGYCTLPPGAFFKEVWPVTVKSRGLGASKLLAGENRLCLTATSLVLVRFGASGSSPSVTLPLLSVRRFGHLDGLFYLELGRSAPNGPGEIWMEAKQQALAQHIHESIRETIRALRALPDLCRSPASRHTQPPGQVASKRCRPKLRDRGRDATQTTTADVHISPARGRVSSDHKKETKCDSPVSFYSLRVQDSPVSASARAETNASEAVAQKMDSWDSNEGKKLFGYMVMSPTSTKMTRDDYETMESPQKPETSIHSSSSSSSLQSLFGSFSCNSPSSLDLSHRRCPPRLDPRVGQPHSTSSFSPGSKSPTLTARVSNPSAARTHWLPACFLSCVKTEDRT